MHAVIKNFTVEDLTPKPPAKYAHLIDKVLIVQKISFEITGASNAIANALRRVIAQELEIMCLHFDISDFKSTDPFCISTVIQKRIRLIPILQNVSPNAKFELNFTNNNPEPVYVYSSAIHMKSSGKQTAHSQQDVYSRSRNAPPSAIMNQQIPLFTLAPGQTVQINNIRPVFDYGYNNAAHSLGIQASAVALDQSEQTYSRLSCPRHYKISFISNGIMEPNKIVVYACDTIIERLKHINDMSDQIIVSRDTKGTSNHYLLIIHGESHTMGNLIMRTICDLYPNIEAVTYSVAAFEQKLTLKFICEDIQVVFTDCIKTLIEQFQRIKSFF